MDMVKKLASGVVCAVLGVLSTQAARLPAGYEELEYIESTGTQYVDTGVNITPTMAVEADAQVTVIEKQGRIFGNAYEASDSNGQGYMSFALYMNGANQSQWATAMQDNGGDWVSSGVSATPVHEGMVGCACGPHPAPRQGQSNPKGDKYLWATQASPLSAAALPGGKTLCTRTLHTQALILNELATLFCSVH